MDIWQFVRLVRSKLIKACYFFKNRFFIFYIKRLYWWGKTAEKSVPETLCTNAVHTVRHAVTHRAFTVTQYNTLPLPPCCPRREAWTASLFCCCKVSVGGRPMMHWAVLPSFNSQSFVLSDDLRVLLEMFGCERSQMKRDYMKALLRVSCLIF